jgi:hypothetical protein
LLGALGYWWLRLVHLPLDGSAASVGHAALRLPDLALPVGLVLWALAAVTLPWLVRGHAVVFDALGATVWASAVVAATEALHRHLALPQAALPFTRETVLGAALGVVLAVLARALRGPVAAAVA